MSFTRKLEVSANVAILIVGVAILIVLFQQWRKPVERVSSIPIGAHLRMTGLDNHAPYNLVMGLSTTCHFCTESAPFYQRLLKETNPKKVHFIATFPQPIAQGKDYLKDKSMDIADVRQVTADVLPIRGTPTLLVVDSSGVVKAAWEGKLGDSGEASVAKLLSQ
jgi:thiol-disulfide isomerase/thioredoxin